MNETRQTARCTCETCTTCPGAACTCGCQPTAAPTQPAACACGAQCRCGPGCACPTA